MKMHTEIVYNLRLPDIPVRPSIPNFHYHRINEPIAIALSA